MYDSHIQHRYTIGEVVYARIGELAYRGTVDTIVVQLGDWGRRIRYQVARHDVDGNLIVCEHPEDEVFEFAIDALCDR